MHPLISIGTGSATGDFLGGVNLAGTHDRHLVHSIVAVALSLRDAVLQAMNTMSKITALSIPRRTLSLTLTAKTSKHTGARKVHQVSLWIFVPALLTLSRFRGQYIPCAYCLAVRHCLAWKRSNNLNMGRLQAIRVLTVGH